MSAITPEDIVDSASIAAASTRRKPLWQLAIRNPNVIFGGVILLIMVAIAICAPFLGTVDPTRIDPAARNKKPGAEITYRLEDGTPAKFNLPAKDAELLPPGNYPVQALIDELAKRAGAVWRVDSGVVVLKPKAK